MRVGCGSCSGAEQGVKWLGQCVDLFGVLQGVEVVFNTRCYGFGWFLCKRIHERGRLGWIRFWGV